MVFKFYIRTASLPTDSDVVGDPKREITLSRHVARYYLKECIRNKLDLISQDVFFNTGL